MMVSPVSFRATAPASNFQELVGRKQSYMAEPTAATGINEGEKKKSGIGKKILGLAVVAAAVAGGLAVGHKKGIFTNPKVTNELVKKGLGYLDKAGEAVSKYAGIAKNKAIEGFNWVKVKAGEILSKVKPEKVAQEATEALS